MIVTLSELSRARMSFLTRCLHLSRPLAPHMILAPHMSLTPHHLHTSMTVAKTFEPDYLDTEVNNIPTYPPLNIQMKGYNFDLLESYQGFVHRLAENMGVDVSTAWATPAKSISITTYQEGGVRPKDNYNLHMYERNVQVMNLRSTDASILLDCIQRALPEGVHLRMMEHSEDLEEQRWIADPFIDKLRAELAEKEEGQEEAQIKKAALAETKAARKRELLLNSLLEE